jgi:hypothetical protein
MEERPTWAQTGICQLCSCVNYWGVAFAFWRQFTIEHLIGEARECIFTESGPRCATDLVTDSPGSRRSRSD